MAAARRARSIVNDFSFLIVLFFISAIVSLLTLSLLSSHQLRARPAPLVARLYSALSVSGYIRRGSVCYVSLG